MLWNLLGSNFLRPRVQLFYRLLRRFYRAFLILLLLLLLFSIVFGAFFAFIPAPILTEEIDLINVIASLRLFTLLCSYSFCYYFLHFSPLLLFFSIVFGAFQRLLI